MAEQEKDNTWLMVGLATLFMIVVVYGLKNTDVRKEHISEETTAAEQAKVLKQHKNLNNDSLSLAK